MATFGEIKTRVQTRVIDLPQAVQDEVPSLVNYAYRQAMRKHNFKVMQTILPVTTVEGTHTLVAQPADFKEFWNQPFWTDENGASHPIVIAPNEQAVHFAFDLDEIGSPKVISDGASSDDINTRTWSIWPLPDGASDYEDGEYRINITYYRYLPTLVDDGDENWITNNLEEWITFRAVAEAFGVDWDEERMALWLQRAETEFKEAIKADKILRLGGVDVLVPQWRGQYNPRLRW